MHVLLINGSPNKEGCTYTALSEVAGVLQDQGMDTRILHIGKKAVQGCIACFKCKNDLDRCAFKDDLYNDAQEAVQKADALVVGSPVYYAGPNGSLCALLDRLFFSAGGHLRGKPGAAVVSCRRGGATASFDRLNKYFAINHMPIVTSQYWNMVHGMKPDEVQQDIEGLQTMRSLGLNLAWMLRIMAETTLPRPAYEAWQRTNFIR